MKLFQCARAARVAAPALAVLLLGAVAEARCPPGYYQNRFGRCVPFRTVRPRVCPVGYLLRGGVCVPAVVRPRVCPAGYVLRGGVCVPRVVRPRVCPPGYFYFRGRCVHR